MVNVLGGGMGLRERNNPENCYSVQQFVDTEIWTWDQAVVSHCPSQLTSLNRYWVFIKLKIKSVAYSSQGSHAGQLDLCNWLVDGITTG